MRPQLKNNKLASFACSTQPHSRRQRLPFLTFLTCFFLFILGLLSDYFMPAGTGPGALSLRAASSTQAPTAPRTSCREVLHPPAPAAYSLPVPSARLLGLLTLASEVSDKYPLLSIPRTPTVASTKQSVLTSALPTVTPPSFSEASHCVELPLSKALQTRDGLADAQTSIQPVHTSLPMPRIRRGSAYRKPGVLRDPNGFPCLSAFPLVSSCPTPSRSLSRAFCTSNGFRLPA